MDEKMAICTFFGHRDCPESVKPQLQALLRKFIEQNGVSRFYVGNQGRFDSITRSVLRELKKDYPSIDFCVVLAYMPGKADPLHHLYSEETMLPEGIETVPKRFAIVWRNRWMLKQADYVVTYIRRPYGGAAQFAKQAKRQGKQVYAL
ncbi:MAG: hypothetical protein LUF28_02170 [Clostridiales bacterium]|nr:hypothetical protein [Clostridiales bacterium]